MAEKAVTAFTPDDFSEEGLYLFFPDGTKLDLTKGNIEAASEAFWRDTSKISPEMKKAIDFQKCSFCPRKSKEDICDAIRPVLPFLERVEQYLSYDQVTAVYKTGHDGMIHVRKTSMQKAFQYISFLSLLRYNMVLRKYWKYYYGIIPLMSGEEVAVRVYLNMYWQHRGNKEDISRVISSFSEELRVSSDNQIKRLNLITKSDVLMNAFANTQAVSEFLSMDIEKTVQDAVNKFEVSYTHHF